MDAAWLDGPDPGNDWLEAAGPDGQVLGYVQRREAHVLGLPIRRVEIPKRYIEDSWVRNHAAMAYARGIFSNGQDLNDVQIVLLAGEIIKRRELEENLRTRVFEESMIINNPTLYQEYSEKKQRDAGVEVGLGLVEERVPESVEEFLATLGSFSEDESPGSDKDRESVGWLSSFFNDDELDQMDD